MTNTLSAILKVSTNSASPLNSAADSGDSGNSFSELLAGEMQLQEPAPLQSSVFNTAPVPTTDKTIDPPIDILDLDQVQTIDQQTMMEQFAASVAAAIIAVELPNRDNSIQSAPVDTLPLKVVTSSTMTLPVMANSAEVMSDALMILKNTQTTGDLTDAANTANTAKTANTDNIANIANIANTANTTKTANTANTANTAITANIANTANTANIANTANTANIANTANTTKTANTANTANIANLANIANIANTANTANTANIANTANVDNALSQVESKVVSDVEIASLGKLNTVAEEMELPGLKASTPEKVIATPPPMANSLALDKEIISSSLPVQNLKAANQGPNDVQLNNIAPVLSMSSPTIAVQVAEHIITPRVGTPSWDQAIGQKINWMVMGGQQSASLTLNPPDLGPLQVVIHVNNQHADATFISHQPEVRAALENAMPKLREMMDQSGIQLGECNVSSQTKQQQEFAHRQTNANQLTGSAFGIGSAVDLVNAHQPAIARGVGLVDTFV